MDSKQQALVPWKSYIISTAESLLAFYLATFSIGMYFLHRPANWFIPGLFLGLLYLFVIVVCAKRILEKVSIAALMLIIPMAPLIALIIIVTLIPILEQFI
jgi:predicted membrane-bound dolichyl-phosphate-mannose-protein mannosyltransferase